MLLYDILREKLPQANLLRDEPMSLHTGFRIGGPAEVMLMPRNTEELKIAIDCAKDCESQITFIGKGTNLLVKDGGIKGLVIRFNDEFGGIDIEDDEIHVKAGESLARLSAKAMEAGLSGLEFANGIPGSLGGAMAMNAGAYGGQMSDVTLAATLLNVISGEISVLKSNELEMGYRTSHALKTGKIVLSARLKLRYGDKAQIKAQMDELNRRRREKQPLNYPSAGSTFKRPEGHFAGQLIEQAGLKGMSVGGAQVSELHAGFIINKGDACARDVLELIKLIQTRVFDQSGVMLEPEIRILGQD